MIIAERKPIKEILSMISGLNKILLLGCKGCVTVCSAGGEREVAILATIIRMAGKKNRQPVEIVERTLVRQCDPEYVDQLSASLGRFDAVLSMACGVGVNFLADRHSQTLALPAVNTKFYGGAEEQGVWSERCAGCGDCILDRTGGLCPVARCSKGIFNGPCGGSVNGKCEVSPDVDCVWQLIYDRLKGLKQLDRLDEVFPVKDWGVSAHGGPRKMVREDLRV